MKFNSNRSPVYSTRGIVAASQPLAVAAGLEILAQGGTAADAAVATAAALNVTEPMSTGIGGDAFALFYDAQTKQVSALNGSGRAPQGLSLARVLKDFGLSESNDAIPDPLHAHNVTVPGACAAWVDTVAQHGRLALADVLAPAIRLAEEGFPVAPLTAHYWARGVTKKLAVSPNGAELTIAGRAPRPGEIFRNPGLAKTFQAVAAGGAEAFYQGPIGEAIVAVLKANGGTMTVADLAGHASTWETPIATNFHGYDIWECPPNGQGLAALLALNILEGFDLSESPALSTERLHLMIEAMRLAFADTAWYVSDPVFNSIPVEQLLSKEYAAQRRALIDRTQATPDQTYGTPTASSDTVYLSVVDSEGNACSFINSTYMSFGSGIVPKGWGFTLQNRGQNFRLDPAHPNVLAPGKRSYHTIIPAMITKDSQLFASYGVMGGFMQPQGHLQVAVNLINSKLDPQAALDLPRFCITDGRAGGQVALEEGITVETMSQLATMGHHVLPLSGYEREMFGRGQIILRDAETGVLTAGSDPRADGLAMSY